MRNAIAISLMAVLVLVACVTTTTTLPDGTVIEERRPDVQAIQANIELALVLIEKYEQMKAVSPEERQLEFEQRITELTLYVEMAERLLGMLDGSTVQRRLELPR